MRSTRPSLKLKSVIRLSNRICPPRASICNANSAMVVTVGEKDFGSSHVLAGMDIFTVFFSNCKPLPFFSRSEPPDHRLGSLNAVHGRRGDSSRITGSLAAGIQSSYNAEDGGVMKSKNGWVLLIMLLSGIVLGGFIGMLTANVSGLT